MLREDTIGFRIRELNLALKRAHTCPDSGGNNRGCSGKPTRIQGWVIGYLYDNRESDVYQRDMEKDFSVSRPTMTAILQLMEKNGLVERVRDENDTRLKKITLTEEALRLHELHEREIEKLEECMRSGISDDEIELFFRISGMIEANLKELGGREETEREKMV